MLYVPDSFVITLVTIPVCVFVAVTVTPGIKACEESWTNPPTDAFPVCANTLWAEPRHKDTIARTKSFLTITPPPWLEKGPVQVRCKFVQIVSSLLSGLLSSG